MFCGLQTVHRTALHVYTCFLAASEELLKLAQVAYDEQQGAQQGQDPYAAAMQAQFDPAAWAAYGGMPMGMNHAMMANYYYPGLAPMAMPNSYSQTRHPSLSKPEHQGRFEACLTPLSASFLAACAV